MILNDIIFLDLSFEIKPEKNGCSCNRVVKTLSLGSNGPEFDSPLGSVIKITSNSISSFVGVSQGRQESH